VSRTCTMRLNSMWRLFDLTATDRNPALTKMQARGVIDYLRGSFSPDQGAERPPAAGELPLASSNSEMAASELKDREQSSCSTSKRLASKSWHWSSRPTPVLRRSSWSLAARAAEKSVIAR